MSASSNYLVSNAENFAATFARVVGDMTGTQLVREGDVRQEERFEHASCMMITIHFAGVIQGEYLLALDESTAAAMIGGVFEPNATAQQRKSAREEYTEFVKEALNAAVGESIQELERSFDGLTFLPAVAVYGELEYPQIPVGIATVRGECGSVDCCFMLNMVNLGVGEKLQQALLDIQSKNSELKTAQRNIENMLSVFPAGLVAIDRTGVILPGYSRLTAATIGLPVDTLLQGRALSEILSFPEAKVKDTSGDFERWIDLVYSRFQELDFKIMEELLPIQEFTNSFGHILHVKCIPITAGDGSAVDRLLLVIDDVTARRKLEDEMKRITRQHDQNVELLSQVVSLEPDEITQFVYDSTDLLSRAEKILQTHDRDRELINSLYRTIHTLKGTSGQFRFKQLQEMAHTIETQLAPLREKDSVNDSEVEPIRKSLEEVNSYVNRIEDLRKKLGGEKETVRSKAERSRPSMIVALDDIDSLIAQARQLVEVGYKLDKDKYYQAMIAEVARRVCGLRTLNVGFFLPSLVALAQRTADRFGKRVTVELRRDATIDIAVVRRVHEAFIHIVNNAVDHGIELPNRRTERGKVDRGIILIDCVVKDSNLIIAVKDDGAGVNIDLVRDRLVERCGYTPARAAALSESAALETLLLPGFSTKDEVTETSGRGVGLDVAATVVKELGGRIRIESRMGKGTEVIMELPERRVLPAAWIGREEWRGA